MKLLLDECVTRYLKPDFVGHEVLTIDEAQLKGFKNGQLLRAASGVYDVLITVDKNLPHQQNIGTLKIAVLILVVKNNKYADLQPLVPKALEALKTIQKGEIMRVES